MVNEQYKLSLSLQTLKEQRKRLIQDCENNYNLLHGLRSDINSEVYKLYAEKYSIMWIDAHWNQINKSLESKVTYDRDKNAVMKYFAKYFKDFMKPYGYFETLHTEIFLELLRVNLKIIKDLIAIDDKSHENLNMLLNAQDKHKKEYEDMIEKAKRGSAKVKI